MGVITLSCTDVRNIVGILYCDYNIVLSRTILKVGDLWDAESLDDIADTIAEHLSGVEPDDW